MINGELPTWFIVKWLSDPKHELHTAKAPDTESRWPCETSTDGTHIEFLTKWPPEYGWLEDGGPPIRNDWTLYREDGKPVRFRDKISANQSPNNGKPEGTK